MAAILLVPRCSYPVEEILLQACSVDSEFSKGSSPHFLSIHPGADEGVADSIFVDEE